MSKDKLYKIIFITLAIILAGSYTIYIQINGGYQYVENHSYLSELGEALGGLGYFLLILVYGRTLLKIIVRKGTLWQRLEPYNIDYSLLKNLFQKLLYILNKTHAYIGTLAIITIFLHCYFTASFLDNLLLRLVLIVLAWQGIFGAFLQFKFTPGSLKRKSYLLHAQFISGVLILILAAFGHLLLEN